MITVITPTLNAASLLPGLCESIRAAGGCEHIVIDGGSTDATTALAESLGCRVIHAPGTDIYQAQNIGIATATRDWLFFAGADDFILPDALERLAKTTLTANWIHALMGFSNSQIIRYANQQQSFLYHKSLYEKYGNYKLEDGLAADVRFNMRLRYYKESCQKLDFALASFTQRCK